MKNTYSNVLTILSSIRHSNALSVTIFLLFWGFRGCKLRSVHRLWEQPYFVTFSILPL